MIFTGHIHGLQLIIFHGCLCLLDKMWIIPGHRHWPLFRCTATLEYIWTIVGGHEPIMISGSEPLPWGKQIALTLSWLDSIWWLVHGLIFQIDVPLLSNVLDKRLIVMVHGDIHEFYWFPLGGAKGHLWALVVSAVVLRFVFRWLVSAEDTTVGLYLRKTISRRS
jgi:hypothetical protein